MIQAAIDLVVVAAVWYFFGTAWGVLAIVVCLFSFWATITNKRLDRLETEMANLRQRSDAGA